MIRQARGEGGIVLPAPLLDESRTVRVTVGNGANAKTVDVSSAAGSVVMVYTSGVIRYRFGADEPSALSALTTDGSGEDLVDGPALRLLIAVPKGVTHIAMCRDSAATADADVTVMFPA